MPSEQKIFVAGPAGKLETVISLPDNPPRGLAVVAHPHPLYHGSMDNKIVYTLIRALIELGFLSVKFNFRGVGKSEGSHGEGKGEVEDVLAVTQSIRNQYQTELKNSPLILAGFSFGGGIQAHAAQQLNPNKLILVAPSVERLHAPPVINHAEHVLIIQGDQDDIVPLKTVMDWAAPQKLAVTIVPGAEHFFHGKLSILKHIVLQAYS